MAVAGNPADCTDSALEGYSYMAMCPNSDLLLLEVGTPENLTTDPQTAIEVFTGWDYTGWWAADENWLVLGPKGATAAIAEAHGVEHIHTRGMSELVVDGLPYQWEDFVDEKPEVQVGRLADEIKEATDATCDDTQFTFDYEAVASDKCSKADGSGAYTIGVFDSKEDLDAAMAFFTKTIVLLDAPYYTLVGESWIIMNVEKDSADKLQEEVGGKLKQLSS